MRERTSDGKYTATDISGRKYGKLTVICLYEFKKPKSFYLCRCECGNEKIINVANLNNGHTKSCGCLKYASKNKKHGLTNSAEYKVWSGIKRRCYNKNEKNFNRYGGRGIKVAIEWLNSFETFLNDMGKRPSKNHQIDRINPDGDYEKNNCRWVTIYVQAQNKKLKPLCGARKHGNRFRTSVQWNGIEYNLGSFKTKEAAHEAYMKARKQLQEKGEIK